MHEAAGAVTARDIVGREPELDRIHAFLGRRDELPGGLVIEGPAGAGKTTIWRAGIDAARSSGYLVLSCRPAGAEVQLSHAALSDLLEGHLADVLPRLPGPQQRALEVALLLEDDRATPPDQRAVAAGALNALRALAAEHPVLLAIDDVQWVDAQSAAVIEFALRRLGSAPVAVLASRRIASPAAEAPSPVAGVRPELALERPVGRIDVGPMSLGAISRVVRSRLDRDLSRWAIQRIHETSGGNPFFALELARAMPPDSGELAHDGAPLALGTDLGALLSGRLAGFDETTRAALFVAAALTQPTVETVAGAMAISTDAALVALAPAARAQIVRLATEAIEFTHPLLAAAAYAALDPVEQRRWHGRIAESSDDVESAARHLAVARPGPDEDVAGQLVRAARSARARGAPTAAAELFDRALATLPPADDERSRQRRAALVAEAAPLLLAAGRTEAVRTMLEASIDEMEPGPLRSSLKLLLGGIVESDEAGLVRQMRLVDEALEEAAGDPGQMAAALLDREQIERARDRSPDALPLARRALEAAEASGDERLLARAHVRAADLEVVLGLADDPVARFARALELGERVPVDAENSARSMLAVCLIRAGRLDEARVHLHAERTRASAEGDEASFCWVSLFLAELEWLAGHWEDAARIAAEALEVAEQARLRMRTGGLQALGALVESSRGDPARARTLASRAIAILDEVDEVAYGNYARQILAFLDLSQGDAAAAREQLQTFPPERLEGSKRLAFIGDQIEALVQLGDLDEAIRLADALADRGARLARPPLVATALRCRALVLGARGDLEAALASAAEAVEIHARLGLPFEHARSLLVRGEVQRRAKQRRAARETLTEAIETFNRLGAHLWSARAEAERARIGGRTAIEGLSETELRVARLVAEGHTNKEVAAALFVSVRAVEANLSKVYAKLGIESRTELARRL